MMEIKRYFFSYFVFLEFILTWVYFSNQWNHTLYFHGWWWISYILIFRSFHAQDLIFIEFSIRALPILIYWFMPKMSNSLTKIHFLVCWRSVNLRKKFWCLQISQKANQILDRFLSYEARAEICQKFSWLFWRFEYTKHSFWD